MKNKKRTVCKIFAFLKLEEFIFPMTTPSENKTEWNVSHGISVIVTPFEGKPFDSMRDLTRL